VAPEVLNATGYDKEVDMWSIGVITYILLCGFPPFFGDSMPALFEQILQGRYDYPQDYWGDVSEDAIDFIDRLLVVDRVCETLDVAALLFILFPAGETNDGCSGAGAQVAVLAEAARRLGQEARHRPRPRAPRLGPQELLGQFCRFLRHVVKV
jgi:serine/threonine protein kinase